MKHFWNWIRNEDTGQRELWFEGVIASESWFNDDITPAMFKEELFSGSGPITLHISSPGGDCVAAKAVRAHGLGGDLPIQAAGHADQLPG